MATFNTPILTITGSSTPGKSDVTVEYTVTFDKFDVASDYPYSEVVKIIGDDTGVGDVNAGFDDLLFMMVPGSSSIRASDAVGAVPTLKRIHQTTMSNATLDEDTSPVLNPDEIRAVVTLTPVAPKQAGPTESNLVALTLP